MSKGSPKDRQRETIMEFETSPERIKQIIQSVGTQIGSVHFRKRKDNELRKMSYRLHVTAPSAASVPQGLGDRTGIGTTARKQRDDDNTQITVLDVNKVVRDNDGNKIGRGAWRTIPLENVVQVTANGKVYKIKGRG